MVGVPGQLEHFHPVAQRRRNGFEHVGRSDEHYPGQIERDAQVVVCKGMVLLGVEHFKKRRRRVAPEVLANLVDLVQHEHGIVRLRPADALYDSSRQRPDIGSPMSPDLGFIVHAAQRHPHEFSAQRPGDAHSERRFTDARRPYKTQDRPFCIGFEFADCQIFEHPFFDFLEIVMIFVQHVGGCSNVQMVFGPDLPRQIYQPLDICSYNRILGSSRVHSRQTFELVQGFFLDFFGHLRLCYTTVKLLDLGAMCIRLAKLFLDSFHLFAKQRFPLCFLDRAAYLRPQIFTQFEQLDLARYHRRHPLVPFEQIHGLEQTLFLFERHVQVGGYQVEQRARIVDPAYYQHSVGRHMRAEFDKFSGLDAKRDQQRFGFFAAGRRRGDFNEFDPRSHERIGADGFDNAEPDEALDHNLLVTVRQTNQPQDPADSADLVDFIETRLFGFSVMLGRQPYKFAAERRVVYSGNRSGPADVERYHHDRKHHHVAYR